MELAVPTECRLEQAGPGPELALVGRQLGLAPRPERRLAVVRRLRPVELAAPTGYRSEQAESELASVGRQPGLAPRPGQRLAVDLRLPPEVLVAPTGYRSEQAGPELVAARLGQVGPAARQVGRRSQGLALG